MLQWCRDHTGNVKMVITMFYIILIVISVTISYIYYKMCCSVFFHWSNSIIWFPQKQLGIQYYRAFISDVKWFGTEYI